MAVTIKDDMLDPQILVDHVKGEFSGKNAFLGSILVSSGAVLISGTMPGRGQRAIGKTIEIPYFGTIGRFQPNPDGNSVTPSKLAQMSEEAVIERSSLAVETSAWAQGIGATAPELGDPYAEGARQAMVQAEREMDRQITEKFGATPLVNDVYVSGAPAYLDHRLMVRSKAYWGDDQDGIVAMLIHSQVEADLAEQSDSNGRPLLVQSQEEGKPTRFAGVPLLVSDRVPLTGSTMGPVASAGTSPPVATLSGTPMGAWDLRIKCSKAGAHETAEIQFSVDGGNTWSDPIVTKAATVALDLVDPAEDSVVGVDGQTGLKVAFAAGTFSTDNVWGSTANLAVSSLIVQAGSGAYWYNQAALGAKQDTDILADTDIIALHLYAAPHLYRRRRMGKKPGVVRIRHNTRNYRGQAVTL